VAEVRKRSTEKIQILLVDDRQENLLALEAVLSSPDYDLIKSNSGDEALRYLLDHNPALILMDVQMPGLSGFEAAAIIKGNARTRDIPIIFITAINKDERFVHQGYDEGAVD
jgi:two-component system, sporulation sensor kinase E